MNADLVVDVGNSRMKWGRCRDGRVDETVSLSAQDPNSWRCQLEGWGLSGQLRWAASGVDPGRVGQFLDWLRQRGQEVVHLSTWRQLPLRVQVDSPDQVGIDRLLDAVAAGSRTGQGASCLIVDAGTAITVDWVDDRGVFRGGAISPGLRLMGQALHDHTALLPLVALSAERAGPALPGTSTIQAIQAGIFWTAVGGVRALIGQFIDNARLSNPQIFLTGGDAGLLTQALGLENCWWPEMTLEGIRIAAREAQSAGGRQC
jgi:type III pantothenate kinase